MISLLLSLSLAEARDRALIYSGHAAPTDLNWGTAFGDVTSAMRRYGATVDQTSTWPSSLDDYALVMLVLSQNSYTSAQASQLKSVVDAGGAVVMITDNGDYVPHCEGIFNSLASSLGVGIKIDDYPTLGGYDGQCDAGTAWEEHALTRGQPELQYAAVVSTSDGTGTDLYAPGFVTVQDRVLVVGDVNVFVGGCDGELVDNTPFFENLWNWAYGGTCEDTDRDGDGYETDLCGGTDCDDLDETVNPGEVRYEDADGDGHGNPETATDACAAPSTWVAEGDDCDDGDPDTLGDDGPFYVDDDGDGYGEPDHTAFACALGDGLSDNDDDCDDGDEDIHPDADEQCDGVDEDCDGDVDDDAEDAPTWYKDGDEDGYGDPDETLDACEEPEGYVEDDRDCADGDPTTYPGSASYEEICGELVDGEDSGAGDAAAGCACEGLGAAVFLPAVLLAARRRRRTSAGRSPTR